MQNQPFHGLSPAEHERLALLSEECAEVIQIVGKILRHGYDSTHPDSPDGPDNRDMLQSELGHVQFALGFLVANGDIKESAIAKALEQKADKISAFLHHN